MTDRARMLLGACALLVIAGNVLARFGAGGNDWPVVSLPELADAGRPGNTSDLLGDPYETVLYDRDGRIGAALDIDALPVTLVVDGDGVIRYRHLGVLDNQTADTVIVPLVEELRRK